MSIPGKLNTWLAIAGGVVVLIAALFAFDSRYRHEETAVAVAQDLKNEIVLVGARLEGKILQDEIDWSRRTIWNIRDRYEGRSLPREAKERIRELECRIEDLKDKMDKTRSK